MRQELNRQDATNAKDTQSNRRDRTTDRVKTGIRHRSPTTVHPRLGFHGRGVTLMLEMLGGGAGQRSNGKSELNIDACRGSVQFHTDPSAGRAEAYLLEDVQVFPNGSKVLAS